VLDLFAYVGGFSASAGLGGAAEVVSVDLAPEAIAYARQTWSANDLPADKHTATCGAVDAVLERLHGAGRRFDLIVADPPSFAPNAKAKHKAMRAYVQLHRAALDLLESGGFYLGASCSSHVGAADFEATVLEAADKRRRSLQIIDRWGAPGDHPRLPGFFEGDYLAVVLVRAA
jgi:23S rRNA (cytosine1962-C5)-methyltransferase